MAGPEYLVFPLALAIVLIIGYGWRRRAARLQILAMLTAATWIAAVLAVTFFPFPRQSETIEFQRQMQFLHNQLAPLATISAALEAGPTSREFAQAAANVIMFAPLGVLVPLICGPRHVLIRTFGIAVIASLLIELGQFVVSSWMGFTYKVTDVDDVLLNVAGAMLGALLFRVLGPLVFAEDRNVERPTE